MQKNIQNYIKRHSGKSLPELKLALMKHGFTSYQIEQALGQLKEKRRVFFRWFVILLVFMIVLAIIGLVFFSFIKPAEELIKKTEVKETRIAVPSEKPIIPPTVVEEKEFLPEEEPKEEVEEKKEPKPEILPKKEITSQILEDIRQLSNTDKNRALAQCNELDEKDKCIGLIAKNTNDITLCDQITDTKTKDDCFFFFGQADKDICDKISTAGLKNYCVMLAEINEKS